MKVLAYLFEDSLNFAKSLDKTDPLRHFRERFYLKKDTIYMCGNSLGLASIDSEETLKVVIEKWRNEGVKIWNVEDNKYYLYSQNLAKLMAPVVGVDESEIMINTSTTVSIHQAISTFYKPTEGKYKILVDNMNFPTDRYAVDSQVMLKGYDPADAVKVVKCVGDFIEEDDIVEAMTKDVALVLLPTVYYRTSQVLNMKKITDAARDKGIIIGWDLSHAVGAIEIDLKSVDADFAIWCTYKYLNGGPGSPSTFYINKKHFHLLPGLAGWYGNKTETQFQLNQEFDHRKDANGWQIGTPHLLSMAPLEGSLKLILEAGISNMRSKSLQISAYFMYLIEQKLTRYGFTVGNPKEDHKRGGHVCLKHPEAYGISLNLRSRGVISDFRNPNVIRMTPTALYTSYEEVYRIIEILLDIVENETYKQFDSVKSYVV